MFYIRQLLDQVLRAKGYHLQPLPNRPEQLEYRQAYREQARLICQRHNEQTQETVAALKQKYEEPIIGKVSVWSLVERLAQCIDPSDTKLLCTNQQIHVLQILEGMERDGISDPDLILLALVHDVGKVLLPYEAPENVVCYNVPIGEYAAGIGLDNCIFQWNHDEFAYSRLKYYLPDHLAWLVRYHSIRISECEPLMDERDRTYTERYLRVFSKYDHGTKSIYNLPKKSIDEYRDIVEEAFPEPILF